MEDEENLQDLQEIETLLTHMEKVCDNVVRQESNTEVSGLTTDPSLRKDKRFKCSHCGQECKQAPHLTTHLRTHTNEKPYSCSICYKRFSQSSSRNNHEKIHSNEKPFSCSECRVRLGAFDVHANELQIYSQSYF